MTRICNMVEAIQRLREITDKGITHIHDEKDEVFVSYSQLYDRALETLHYLQSRGILSGQELVFQIEDNETFLYVFWACILGKITPIPVAVGGSDEHRLKLFKIWKILTEPNLICSRLVLDNLGKYAGSHCELSDIFEKMKSRAILIEDITFSAIKGEIYYPEESDTAFIQFSSGSTGDPKGVILTHDNVITNASDVNSACGVHPGNIFLSWMPLTHDMGLIAVLIGGIIAGASLYLMPTKLFVNKPVLWLKKAHEHKATSIYSPNFGYKYFLAFFTPEIDYGWDLSSIGYICNGAEPISVELCDEFMNALAVYGMRKSSMKAVYGLAEATVGVSLTLADEECLSVFVDRRFLEIGQPVRLVDAEDKNSLILADVGKPVEHCRVSICDNENNQLDDYVVGNVQISGRNVTRGYYNNREATERAITKDGWLNTGDLGFMRNGRIIITGRAKDIIFVNGQNYYPHDIERVAEEFEEVRLWQTAACGAFNRVSQTEEILLFVPFKRKLEEFVKLSANLKMFILERMGLHIDHIIPVKAIPKTTSGKVQRYKLAEQYTNGEFMSLIKGMEKIHTELRSQTEKSAALTSTEKNLIDIYVKVFGVKSIGINNNFVDCGGNSMMLAQVSEQIDRIYPGRVSVANLFAYPTIKLLAEFINRDDNILIPALRLPEEYFNAVGGGDVKSFEMAIESGLYHKLLKVAGSVDVEVSIVLLSMYIYLLKEISGERKFYVQALINGEDAVSIEVDFDCISDFYSFFRLVGTKFTTPTGILVYSVKDAHRIRFKKDNLSIVPLFSKKSTLNTDLKLNYIYDLVFEMNERNGSLEFVCEYSKRFDSNMVREILDHYLWLLDELSEKFGAI